MDGRVAELIAQMESLPRGEAMDVIAWKDRIVALHHEVTAEEDKMALIRAYVALMDLAERNIVTQGGDATELRGLRLAELRLFCVKEAMVGENVDPHRLAYVTRREIDAGRLAPDDSLHQTALAGIEVLGGQDLSPSDSTPRRGFWSRLFGRGE